MTPRTIPSSEAAGISTRSLFPLVVYLRSIGHDPVPLLSRHGIDPFRMFDPASRVSRAAVLDVWTRAAELARDPAFGLRVAATLDFANVLVYAGDYLHVQACTTSATVGAGLARLARYFPLTYPESRLVCEPEGGDLRVRHVMLGRGGVPRVLAEWMVGWIARCVHQTPSRPVVPREVRFAHPRPDDVTPHAEFFGCAMRFAAGENAAVIRAEDLDVPMRAANPSLLSEVERRGEEQLAALPPVESFTDQVRALIAAELGSGDPGAARAAKSLGLSLRTFARKLGAAGTSYGALLDEVRREHARRYLLDEGRTAAEVAELLGFSEAGAFRRAFRRWFGASPGEFRRLEGEPADASPSATVGAPRPRAGTRPGRS